MMAGRRHQENDITRWTWFPVLILVAVCIIVLVAFVFAMRSML